MKQDEFASIIVDQAIAVAAIPWPCPSQIGPDGRYRLEELIAIGSGSFVYRATDLLLSSQGFDATVAVKIVVRREGVRPEALPARRVEHPNIARVLDRGELDERHDFTVVEYVPSGTLADVEPGWPPAKAAAFVAQIARGMQTAHSAGVCHLDLKPSNVLLTEDGAPKVTDFGLARLDGDDEGPARGTRAFMSPEQGREEAGSLSAPSDIYALGGLLYYLIRGEPPNGTDADTIRHRHETNAPPPRLRVDRDLDRICARALAPDTADRYAAAAQLADDLDRWLNDMPIDWTNPPPWQRLWLWRRRDPASAAAVLVLFLLAVGAFIFWRIDELRRFEQQRLVMEQAHQEIERTRALGRAAIERLYAFAHGSNEEIVQSLVWMNLLYEFMIIEGEAWLDSSVLTDPMQKLIDNLEAGGQGESIESLLARSTLAYWKLREGDGRGSTEQLDTIEDLWTDIVPPQDSYWVRHRAMRAIAEAMLAQKAGKVEESHRAALRQARTDLRRITSSGELLTMVDYAIQRVRK